MRVPRVAWSSACLTFLLVAGCDGGDGRPCIIDSDCPDFTQVCLDGTCQPAGALPEGGTGGTDAGDAPEDAGTATDAGDAMDSGIAPMDAGELDGAVADAEPPGEGGMPCSDVTGDWSVTNILAPSGCESLADGNAASISAGAAACEYAVSSVAVDTPALDGTFVLDSDDLLVPGETSLQVGGSDTAQSCTGSLTGDVLTFTCGACVFQIGR
jgi:hypothetical protein